MTVEGVNNPMITLAHMVVTLLVSGSFLGYVNAVENKQVETDVRQQMIIKSQDEIKQEIKDARQERKLDYQKLMEELRKLDKDG